MKLKFVALAVLSAALVTISPAHAQRVEGTTSSPAAPSTASGQRAEPTSALNGTEPAEKKDAAEALKEPSPVVKKLGGMMGMSPQAAQTAFNWLNFAVLAGAILYALAKALPKTFRARTEGIQKHIVDARVATDAANARLSAVEARLSKLDDEIASIRAESERESAEEEARTKQHIAEETERILKSAEQEIAAASAQAQRNLRAYAAGVAVDRAASRLEISDADDRALIQNFAAKLGQGSTN
ncbi:ATP synthase F0 subunit B [Terriglobus aquaticus]|uniref:ATP synthase subunit b n=1 Tax=Terriglobus aquaticus TaxID=940139 RepID=A0ABW9KI53_9BACT|nr:ATP synthase F0 subunit B [Terriglobus aquaticus]